MSGFKAKLALIAAIVALPEVAFAHTGTGHVHGFIHGFAHPFGALDHVLAMVAVGLIAAQLGGRALWLVPASFLTLMAVGGTLGVAGVHLPYTETLIALSVLVLGLAVALRLSMPTFAATALVGFFAIFHGYAHGSELPHDGAAFGYAVGFIVATALLHALGIGIGLLIGRCAEAPARALVRTAGAATALVGVVFLMGMA